MMCNILSTYLIYSRRVIGQGCHNVKNVPNINWKNLNMYYLKEYVWVYLETKRKTKKLKKLNFMKCNFTKAEYAQHRCTGIQMGTKKKIILLFDSFMKLIIHFSVPSILPAEPVSCLSELWDSLIIASQLQLFPAVLENQLIMIPVVPV